MYSLSARKERESEEASKDFFVPENRIQLLLLREGTAWDGGRIRSWVLDLLNLRSPLASKWRQGHLVNFIVSTEYEKGVRQIGRRHREQRIHQPE